MFRKQKKKATALVPTKEVVNLLRREYADLFPAWLLEYSGEVTVSIGLHGDSDIEITFIVEEA